MSISTMATVAASGQQPTVGKALGNAGNVPKPAASVASAPLASKAKAGALDAKIDKPDAKQVQQSLDDINKVMAGFSISVQFRIDPDYKDLIVKVVDQDTGKLIRQIPTEDVVKMSKAMDNLKGLLFAKTA